MPDVQLSVQLMRQFHARSRIARPTLPRRQLDRARPELDHVILAHHPLVAQTEQPLPVQLPAQGPEIVARLASRNRESPIIVWTETLQYTVGLFQRARTSQPQLAFQA